MNDRGEVSPQTRTRILAAARKLGYVPNANARTLRISDSGTIAVVIQGRTSEVLVDILGDLQHHLAAYGYDTFLQHVPDEEATFQTMSKLVLERKPIGVIFLGRYGSGGGNAEELSRQLASLDIPMVYCTATDLSTPIPRHSSVSIDDVRGCYDLTTLLLERGHRRIAFAIADEGRAGEAGDAWALRYRGYRKALENAGIKPDPELVVRPADPIPVYSTSNGYNSVRDWLAAGPPKFTAMVTTCDAVGLGALRALHEAKLGVPDDVEVTAFDGLELAEHCAPSLTTVVQPKSQIAEATAQVMVDALLQPGRIPEQKLISGKIRLGESTGRQAG